MPCLLLKGRAFASLLYADGTPRPYADCDLLIPLAMRERADAVLAELGFVARDGALHARAWRRDRDGMWVDLHHTLPLLEDDPQAVWGALSARARTISVGGAPTQVLDPAGVALLCALHLVHHGPDAPNPRRDLERAIDQLGSDCWHSAADLARQLGAEGPLGTGLRLVPAGVELADRLGLAWAPSRRTLLDWNGAPWGATVWESLASAGGIRPRVSLAIEFLLPQPDFLRERSSLARAGRLGLWLAYLVRPFQLAVKALRSFGPWRDARRER